MRSGSRPTLIEGGIGNRSGSRRSRRRRTARAAAPLLVPIALAVTLGIILLASASAPQTTHVTQTTSSTAQP